MAGTSPWPLGWAWERLYDRVVRVAVRGLRRRHRHVSVYLRGSMTRGALRPGRSDVDLVAVIDDRAPGAPSRTEILRRWASVRRTRPTVRLIADLVVYPRSELDRQLSSTTVTYGLTGTDVPRALHGRVPRVPVDLALRPGIHAPAAGWRPVGGPPLITGHPYRERHQVLTAAWLELLYWWRHAVDLCIRPHQPRAGVLSRKLVTEPARTWLWATLGVRATADRETLERVGRELPQERGVLEAAEAGARRRTEGAHLPSVMSWLLGITHRIAAEMSAEAGRGEEVALVGEVPPSGPLPLLDWPALCIPPRWPETFELRTEDPSQPRAVASCASADRGGHVPSMRERELLIRPAADWLSSIMRTVACPVTDPVSFALLNGDEIASYPSMPGWSAHDVARRAVNEQRAHLERLDHERGPRSPARMLTGARAAMFLRTLERGHPAIPLTDEALLTWIADVSGAPGLARQTRESLRRAANDRRGLAPSLIELWRAVGALVDG